MIFVALLAQAPAERRTHSFEACSTDPDVGAVGTFGIEGVTIVPTLYRTGLIVSIMVAGIADACRTKPAMIVRLSIVWRNPSLPDERSIAPVLGLLQPKFRNRL